MAYVARLVGKEEKMIGVGRLHYVYVLRGAMWLLFMTLAGVALSYFMGVGLGYLSVSFDTMNRDQAYTLTGIMLNLQHYTLLFCVGVGVLFLLMYLVKYMVTEVGLTSRRVIHKEGFIFVKVRDIDLEEIRGENLDTGWFGRIMNYGYLLLDCRFLGDVRLPALAKAEAFLKALHYHRSHTQDAVSVVVGKGNPAPVEIVSANQAISTGPAVEVRAENHQTTIRPDSQVPVSVVHELTHEAVRPVQMSEPQEPPQVSVKGLDTQIVAQVVSQVVPEIVKEMKDKGLIAAQDEKKAAASDEVGDGEEELINAFDDAAFKTEARSVEEGAKKRSLH